MGNTIRYIHTNIIAKNWKSLSDFYINVFGCVPLYPERNLSGEWLDKITEIKDVKIRGVHLQLPGYENGPTLEIFQYDPENLSDSDPQISRQGFAHIAFFTDDVDELIHKVIEYGGKITGEKIIEEIHGLGVLTVVYMRDPEGNFIELQNRK
ncbi:MAG: VOC family protein [Spirochaetes bacterium]|nr:VOC family protein [Spirochaetota bacterium]